MLFRLLAACLELVKQLLLLFEGVLEQSLLALWSGHRVKDVVVIKELVHILSVTQIVLFHLRQFVELEVNDASDRGQNVKDRDDQQDQLQFEGEHIISIIYLSVQFVDEDQRGDSPKEGEVRQHVHEEEGQVGSKLLWSSPVSEEEVPLSTKVGQNAEHTNNYAFREERSKENSGGNHISETRAVTGNSVFWVLIEKVCLSLSHMVIFSSINQLHNLIWDLFVNVHYF